MHGLTYERKKPMQHNTADGDQHISLGGKKHPTQTEEQRTRKKHKLRKISNNITHTIQNVLPRKRAKKPEKKNEQKPHQQKGRDMQKRKMQPSEER